MAFLYLAGDLINVLQGASSVVSTPSAQTFLPATNLFKYDPTAPFQFTTTGSPNQADITADLNRITNGGFETWASDDPTGWTVEEVGGADVTETQVGAEVNSGTSAAELVGDATNAPLLYQEHEVLSGGRYTVQAALRGDGSATSRFRVQNVTTGRWLNSSLNWVSSATDLATQQSSSYATSTDTFTVEDFATTLRHKCTLRIQCTVSDSSGSGFIDDVAFWPSWDFVAVLGWDQLPDAATYKAQSSTNNFSTTNLDEALTLARPSFFHQMASTSDDRYFRLLLDFTSLNRLSVKPVISELVVGLKKTLTRQQREVYSFEPQMPQHSVPGLFRNELFNLSDHESRRYNLAFAHTTTEFEELYEELWVRSAFGGEKVVIVPDSNRNEVHMGKLLSAPVERSIDGTLWGYRTVFEEDGFAESL